MSLESQIPMGDSELQKAYRRFGISKCLRGIWNIKVPKGNLEYQYAYGQFGIIKCLWAIWHIKMPMGALESQNTYGRFGISTPMGDLESKTAYRPIWNRKMPMDFTGLGELH